MLSSLELTQLFFKDLKQYNSTNFRTISKAKLQDDNPVVHKAFSSVVTRYFIFCERHPDIDESDRRILYFKLKIDMIAKYFSEYPDTNLDLLRPFQLEIRQYIEDTKNGGVEDESNSVAV